MSEDYPRFAATPRLDRGRQAARNRLAPDVRLVLVGIGVLLGLTAVGILVTVLLMLGVRDDTSHLTDSQIQYATAINAAALNAKAIANDERGYLLTGRQEFIRQLDDRTIRARGAFAVAAAEADSREQRAAVRKANEGFEAWIHALHEESNLFQAGKREEAIEMSLATTRPIRKEYERSLDLAQELGVDAIQDARRRVSASSTRSLEIVLGYLVVSLAIGLAGAAWIVWRLRRRPDEAQRGSSGGRLRRIA
jgi:methyl-accepting chemotaxis protein